MAAGYTYALSEVVSEYAFRLPRREQKRLAEIFRALSDAPHRMGNYVTTDHTGRALQNLLVDHYVVTYWADHAAREVRLVEVASV